MGKPVVLEEFGFGSLREVENAIGQEATPEDIEAWVNTYKQMMDTAFSAGASGVIFCGWGVPETKAIPLWWKYEDHDMTEEEFCALLKEYQIPVPAQP